MKCSGCGKGLVGDETFCPTCGMKIDHLHRPSALTEVLVPLSPDISATVKRNKRWYILAAVLATAAVSLVGWASHRANVKAVKAYLWKQGGEGSSKLLSVYSDLHAVRLSDQPGYSGVLGKYDAKRSGEALLAEEQQDYEAVRNRVLFGLLPTQIKICVDVLHTEKVKEIQRVLSLAKKSFIRDAEFEAGLEAVDKNSWSKCNTAYVQAYETSVKKEAAVTLSPAPSQKPVATPDADRTTRPKEAAPPAPAIASSLLSLDFGKHTVRCPETFTGSALNQVFMRQLASAFAPPNVDHFKIKKQPRYMMNVFQEQTCGGAGQDALGKQMCENENNAASQCIQVNGVIYGVRVLPQPHYMARESIALVNLPSTAFMWSTDPDAGYSIVDGDVEKVRGILRALGYTP
jgi:hypothetical protein